MKNKYIVSIISFFLLFILTGCGSTTADIAMYDNLFIPLAEGMGAQKSYGDTITFIEDAGYTVDSQYSEAEETKALADGIVYMPYATVSDPESGNILSLKFMSSTDTPLFLQSLEYRNSESSRSVTVIETADSDLLYSTFDRNAKDTPIESVKSLQKLTSFVKKDGWNDQK